MKRVGQANLCCSIDDALEREKTLLKQKREEEKKI
jgi:hypothetical protein